MVVSVVMVVVVMLLYLRCTQLSSRALKLNFVAMAMVFSPSGSV